MGTPVYIWSGGSNATPYQTWATAASSTTSGLADAIAGNSAGCDYYMDAAMNISNSTAQTVTFKGTFANPDRFFSCSTITHEPPLEADISSTPGAQFTTTGSSAMTLRGVVYCRAITWNVGSGAGTANLNIANATANEVNFDNCIVNMLATGASAGVGIGAGTGNGRCHWNNTPIVMNGGTGVTITINNSDFTWSDTPSAVQGTQSALANLFSLALNTGCDILFQNVDFAGGTGIASGKNIIAAAATDHNIQFVDCKYKTGAVLCATPTGPGMVSDVICTATGATNWEGQRKTYMGTLDVDTSVYNNATDGTNHYSWKIVTTANAKPMLPFESFVFSRWVTAGTYAASKVFFTSATGSLKTDDVWVEGLYLGTNYALGSRFSTYGAGSSTRLVPLLPGLVSGGSAITTGASWGTGGAGTNYSLDIPSFTTSSDGFVYFVVKVGKLSLTIYVDPKATVA